MAEVANRTWWERAVIYEVYTPSFMDSNGDGIGDLRGVTDKLNYLRWLGVDAIWLTPFYESAMADCGYDVSNHIAVDPIFGTMRDFDDLVAAAHWLGLKVLVDLVPNHTSDRHPWFLESKSSRLSAKRDWYIWRDPLPAGGVPNNWLSHFGGSAWEWDSNSGQYYYHAFLKEQPDLNWRSPGVQSAMHSVMRFWLDRGVDGFRVDVIHHLAKDPSLRNNPPDPNYESGMPPYRRLLGTYSADQPEVHAIIAAMRRVLSEYPERVMIGEAYLPPERLVTYYGDPNGDPPHVPFNFNLISSPWEPAKIVDAVMRYESLLPSHAWPMWVLGNHDKPRVASRVGQPQARVAAMLLLTLRGTPTIYYGDEIGMQNSAVSIDKIRDPLERNLPGLGLGRDPSRTPMQWDDTANAGFSVSTPWLPIADDFQTTNAAKAQVDQNSLLTFCRKLIHLRRAELALALGSYGAMHAHGDVMSYVRENEGRALWILLNFGALSQATESPTTRKSGRVLLSTHMDRDGEYITDTAQLRGNEGLVVELLR